MEQLLELKDLVLYPKNMSRVRQGDRINYLIPTETGDLSLPVFASPMDSIVSESTWNTWNSAGIRTILPRTEPLETRLEACQYCYVAFSIDEIQKEIYPKIQYRNYENYMICVDSGNGQTDEIADLGIALKQALGDKVRLISPNITTKLAYSILSQAGYDFVRVGMFNSSCRTKSYGFHYPMGSLLQSLQDVKGVRAKIIADGGIRCVADIMKAIALGADYVMLGRQFAKLLEAAGPLYKCETDLMGNCDDVLEIIENPESLANISKEALKDLDLVRYYSGNTSIEAQTLRAGGKLKTPRPSDSETCIIRVKESLQDWVSEFKECIDYGFSMTGSLSWDNFKRNVGVGRKTL